MNKKLIFIIYFFLLCILPVALMGAVSQSISENRTLSGFPTLTGEDGSINLDFFDEFETYLAEHFAFRSQLVELDGDIKYNLFRSPSDDQVVLGRDGWLFFDSTLNDYTGVTLSDEEIAAIADKLSAVCGYIRAQGGEPLILIAPNKNSIYPEYMPARFGDKAEVTNLTLLQEAMTARDIPYVDACAILKAYKDTDEVYLHEDTHWNNTGARLVLNEVYRRWGIDAAHSLDDYTIEATHEPDLYQILFPAREHYENQRIYEQNNAFDYVGRVHSMDDMLIETTSETATAGSVLMYRDSFGRAIIPYMSEIFTAATYNRSTPYDLSLIAEGDYDYVLIEIVERNIETLGEMEVPE